MSDYEPAKIEPKWQKFWEEKGFYQAEDFSDKPKLYFLVEFPYPSGAGLHVGHCRSYTAMDVIVRKKEWKVTMFYFLWVGTLLVCPAKIMPSKPAFIPQSPPSKALKHSESKKNLWGFLLIGRGK